MTDIRKIPAMMDIEFPECELIEEKVIDEKSGDKVQRWKMKVAHEGQINGNGRKYPKGLIEREFKRLLPAMKERRVWGSAYHPKDSAESRTVDTALLWVDAYVEKDGTCVGIAETVNTRAGKDTAAMFRQGRPGISIRGYGTVTEKTMEGKDGKSITYHEVNPNYRMITPGDVVLNPSVHDSGMMENITEELQTHFSITEDEFNRITNVQNVQKKEKEVEEKEIKSIEDLRAAHPDLVTQVEDAAKKSVEDSVQTEVEKQLKAKKEEWKTEITKEIEEKHAPVQKNLEAVIEGVRTALTSLSELPGVVPEGDEGDEDDTGTQTSDSKLEKKIEDLEAKNKALEDKIAAKEKEDEDAKAASEEAGKVKERLESELGKDEYKSYRTLLEEDLKDVEILKEDEVEGAVKRSHAKLSKLFAEAKKKEIVESDLEELGKIEDPEGKKKRADQLKEEQGLQERYDEAVDSGYLGDFETYKKEFADKV